LWLSSQTLDPETFPLVSSQSTGLECEFSLMPMELAIPIAATTSLAKETDTDRGPLIYDSNLAEEGPAGRYALLKGEEDHSHMGLRYFLIDVAEVPQRRLSAREFSKAVRNFQSGLSKMLCSPRCSFTDAHSAEEAVARTLNLEVLNSRVEYIERYASLATLDFYGLRCPSVVEDSDLWHLGSMQSYQTLGHFIGSLRVGPILDPKLSESTLKAFETSCDYHLVYMLRPGLCPPEQFSQLAIENDVIVEACSSNPIEMPVRYYAVTLDFNHHGEALSFHEDQTEDAMLNKGMTHWPAGDALFSDERFKSRITSERTLRQRIYILYDSRVRAFPYREVCPAA
jgi:hypothetical protein